MTKHSLTQVTTLLLSFILFAVFGIYKAQANTAVEASQLLQKLHELRVNSYSAVNHFHMFNGFEGDHRFSIKINEHVNNFDSVFLDVSSHQLLSVHDEMVDKIDSQWSSFKEVMQSNRDDITNLGYPDLRMVDMLIKYNIELINTITQTYVALQQTAEYTPDPLTERSRQQSLLLLSISAQYAARNTYAIGTFLGETEKTIDSLADQFEVSLTQLRKALVNSQQINKELKAISTKWNFIENSLKNYNEDSVPYLVNLYSHNIVGRLETVAQLYETVSLR